ncbi:MFS transporter [Massilia sp. YIM B02443]|uniref:MFS transporter n=1 Tax=Massilia sp. YIM B02443 TaxID=3050127 RepID=UPI0025B6E601|nr:MFS transporter [Massilia sp. YIM B02443]MDN4036847.1 MFS transporter [Massilia sp. YIM B02443]
MQPAAAPGPAPAALPMPRLSGLAVFFYVFLPFALGHYLSSLLRNVNAVLASNLVGSLALTPGQLGLLTSAFFFAFALVQLPVGIALDRHGPRRVQLTMLLLASFGALLFARGEGFMQLLLARAVMGCGLGGCFMAAVKAMSTWIAPNRLPSVHGYLIAVGGMGAASATMPVRAALEYTDWRGLFLLLAGLVACTGLLIALLYPKSDGPAASRGPLLPALREVWRAPSFRSVVSLVLIPHAVFFGIQGLWIGRWLSDVAHYPEDAVAYLLYLGMAAVVFGAIAVGMLTEWAGRRGMPPLDVAAAGITVFVLVQAAFVIGYRPSFQVLSVLFTLVGTITGIEYAIVAQAMPRELTGRAATFLNLLIFIGAFLVQAGFGLVVGLWPPDLLGHAPAQAYRVGFALLVLIQLPGLWLFARRRKRVAAPPAEA